MDDFLSRFDRTSQTALEWYVVQCRAHKELQVASIIKGTLGLGIYVPVVKQPVSLRSQEVALFPGYFFVCADLQEMRLSSINTTPGVVRLLSTENQPQRVPSELVETIRSRVREVNTAGGLSTHTFQQGDRVRFKNGPMKGLDAVFLGSTKPSVRVKILLQFLGRPNEMQVNVSDLEYATDHAHPQRQRGTRGHGRRINAVAAT